MERAVSRPSRLECVAGYNGCSARHEPPWHEARILAEQERVQAELERLGLTEATLRNQDLQEQVKMRRRR